MRAEGHRTDVREVEENLWGFSVEPKVGIGQRSLLVVTRAISDDWSRAACVPP